MSQTVSTDPAGPGRWQHMASVMSEVLDSVTQSGSIDLEGIPPAVLHAARRFFDLASAVLEGNGLPENPQASVANYKIAADAIRASEPAVKLSRPDLERRIRDYQLFLAQLSTRADLSREEVQLAGQLSNFFKELASEGAAEQYEHFASLSAPRVTLR